MTIKILMGNAYLTTISQITGLYMNDKMDLRIFWESAETFKKTY